MRGATAREKTTGEYEYAFGSHTCIGKSAILIQMPRIHRINAVRTVDEPGEFFMITDTSAIFSEPVWI
jgi:hypothetical protein